MTATAIIFALPKREKMYKTGHAFTYLLLKESVANNVINVSLFAGPVCCKPRHIDEWRRHLSACFDAEGGHFEHYL